MWAAISDLLLSLFKWYFGQRQQAQGEAQGQAEQKVADQGQELSNVQKADSARNAVTDDANSILHDPNRI